MYYMMKMGPDVNLMVLASSHILELGKDRDKTHFA